MEESKQFTHPLLAQAYDSINALGEDADFWLSETEKLAPETVILLLQILKRCIASS